MPRPKDIPPTVTQQSGPMEGVRKAHPAYGMLRFSRIQGGQGKMFGSEINHNSYIQMELCPGEEHRSLSNTYYYGRSQILCSVMMSHAQFAEMITSMNIGSGVPVTIDFIADDVGQRPGIADTETLHEQIQNEVKERTEKVTRTAAALEQEMKAMLADSKVPKAKQAALLELARQITMELQSNMPFVLDQYQEAAEKVGAKAKAELEAYTTAVIHRLGEKALAALNEPPPKLALKD